MTPKRASYTFITIPSPLVLPDAPERERSGAPSSSTSTAALSHDGGCGAWSGISAAAAHPDVAANVASSSAVAAERETTDYGSASASTSASAYAGASSSSATATAEPSPRSRGDGAAAAPLRSVAGDDAQEAAAAASQCDECLTARRKAAVSVASPKADVLAEERKSCSQGRPSPRRLRQHNSDNGLSQGQHPQRADNIRAAVVGAASDMHATSVTSSSFLTGNTFDAAQESSLAYNNGLRRSNEAFSMASSISTVHYRPAPFLPPPSLSSSPDSSSFSSSRRFETSGFHSNAARTGESAGRALAPVAVAERLSAGPLMTNSRNGERQNSSSTSGLMLPSFADTPLPPLAVEDAAVMLREFAALLQRLEHSGQQVLQQQKQPPHNMRVRDQRMQHRLSPQEQLQQQAMVCASLSARLERLFEARAAAYSAELASSGSPEMSPGSVAGDCASSQKKPMQQLMLPGMRSRAGIQEPGNGEDDWPEDGSSHRIGLRTLGTFSTLGTSASVSLESTHTYSPPRNSLEIHRGRLRLAKLKEDFERLQQKHERLVTLFNIRMLLPLSRRKGANSGRSGETSSGSASPPARVAVAGSSSGEKQQCVHIIASDASTSMARCLSSSCSSSGNENDARAAAEAGGTAVLSAAAAQDSGFLGSLDYSHFAGDWGAGEEDRGSTTAVRGALSRSPQRRHSSCSISCTKLVRFPSGGIGGAYTPLRSLLRYTSTGSSSSGGGGGGGEGNTPCEHSVQRLSGENGFGTFFSFNDSGSVSLGDALPPIYLFPKHERDKDRGGGPTGQGITEGSPSQRRSSVEGRQQREKDHHSQRGEKWEAHNSSTKSAADIGLRWSRGESSLLFPGEASLENIWKPTRLQEVDEGFEEQKRREQLQQLQHIEECVHVLQELHVQIADEVEASEEPLAAVAAETDGAAEQTARANRELVTASLRRSRWWGVQGGGVAAAAGVVVGGLAGGPIGAAVGLLCGAFIGATSGSALEREHRHKLLRLTRGRRRTRRPPSRQGEQQTQPRSAGVPVLGADQRQPAYGGEQELVSRPSPREPSMAETRDRDTSAVDGYRRVIHGRVMTETRIPQPRHSTYQQVRATTREKFVAKATSAQELDAAAVTAARDGRAEQQQRRHHRQLRFSQRENCFRGSNGPSTSRSAAATTHNNNSGTTCSNNTAGGALRCSDAIRREADKISSRTAVCTRSSSGKEVAHTHTYDRQGGGQRVKRVAAQRKRDKLRSPNVPLPSLLGWGGSSAVLQQPGSNTRGRATPGQQLRAIRSTPA